MPVMSLSPRPPMVAVEMAGGQIVALHLAILQPRHLPDEVDGDVVTLTFNRSAPRPRAPRSIRRGRGGGAKQHGEQEYGRQHYGLSSLAG